MREPRTDDIERSSLSIQVSRCYDIYKYPNRTVCSVLPSHPQRIDRGLVQDCSPRYNQIPLFKILRNLLPRSSSENGTN